jgi:hypothetical protein
VRRHLGAGVSSYIADETRKVWDFNLGIGGPIARDQLWYYANLREEGSERTVPGMFANANAGDATKWTYVADTSRPAVLAASRIGCCSKRERGCTATATVVDRCPASVPNT